MKIKFSFISIILLAILLVQCTMPPPPERMLPPVSKKIPEVRIGIGEELETLHFESEGKIEIYDGNRLLYQSLTWGQQWKVKTDHTQPSTIIYRLRHKEVYDKTEAKLLWENLRDRGIPVVIKPIKKRMFYNGRFGWTTSYLILLEPEFSTEQQAYDYRRNFAASISAVALPFIKAPPKGDIILINQETGEQFRAAGIMKIRGDRFTITLDVGEGFHFAKEEIRKYQGQLEFIIDRFGKLTVVNVLSLDNYLKGVVGSEMQAKFPLEALKAQAITARGYSLAKIGKQHRLSPFDLCDEVHCHVYGGVGNESKRITKAVLKTSGLVLMHNGKICDTFYAGVCGGHTESNEYVWSGEPQTYLKGVLDAEFDSFSDTFLQDEDNVRLWIESSPNVFCNTLKQPVPDFLEYSKKYFRWQVRYSQIELSDLIRKKTGQNIGRLLEIVPVSRGISGRLTEIKLKGTRKTIVIEKELAIRKALSANYLYSSCFVVDRENGDFIIKGAGWGHGVGMCQTGAAMMALKGYSYREILNHYYNNADIVKLY